MRQGIRICTALLVSLATLAFVAAASAATLTGTVVHHNSRAHSFVIAESGGKLIAIHARRAPALGRQVRVQARHLANGTWQAQVIRVVGSSHRVTLRGTVTHVDAPHRSFVVSARGVSLLVHDHASRSHNTAPGSGSEPSVGDVVTVGGTVSGPNTIDADAVQTHGQDTNGIDLEGTVKAIDATARTLTVSADDSDQSAQTLTVDVPASFDMTKFSVGQEVELIVSLNPDGTYTLQQSSEDGNAQQAGNPQDNQGDGQGDQQPSAEQVCRTQQRDANFASTHNGLGFTAFWETDPNQPNDAFGRCVDGMAQGTAANPSPELACHTEHSDPSFPGSHNGQSFAQFYNPSDPTNLSDAYGRCIDSKSQQADGSGSEGSTSGGSGSGGSTAGSSGAGGSSGSD